MSEVKVSAGPTGAPLLAVGGPQQSLVFLRCKLLPSGFTSVTWPPPPHASSPCVRTPVPGFTAHPNPVWLPLN